MISDNYKKRVGVSDNTKLLKKTFQDKKITNLPGLLKNVLVVYAEDSTLFCRIQHLRDRDSLNDDLAMISDSCSRWGMLVNPSKTRGCLFLVLVRWTLVS